MPAPPIVAAPAEELTIVTVPDVWEKVPATEIPPEFVTEDEPTFKSLVPKDKVPKVTVTLLVAVRGDEAGE